MSYYTCGVLISLLYGMLELNSRLLPTDGVAYRRPKRCSCVFHDDTRYYKLLPPDGVAYRPLERCSDVLTTKQGIYIGTMENKRLILIILIHNRPRRCCMPLPLNLRTNHHSPVLQKHLTKGARSLQNYTRQIDPKIRWTPYP